MGSLPLLCRAAMGKRDAVHALLPDMTERLSADIAHHLQIETAPPAPPTPGAIHRPVEGNTGIEGGVRARMKQEDEQ